MKRLADKNEQFTSGAARKAAKEINEAIGKIVSRYARSGYSLADVERLTMHAVMYQVAMTRATQLLRRKRRRPSTVAIPTR